MTPEPRLRAIETDVGLIRYRDAIFLDALEIDLSRAWLLLRGEINGHNATRAEDDSWIGYELQFSGVLALYVVELESSTIYDLEPVGSSEHASFGEVIGSRWLQALARGDKFTPKHRHFLVQTYDDVVEVAATTFALRLTGDEPKPSR